MMQSFLRRGITAASKPPFATRRSAASPSPAATASRWAKAQSVASQQAPTLSSRFATATTDKTKIYGLESHPPLVEIPSLPFVGSMIPWHSGIAAMDFTREREYLLELKEKFGYFYSIGIPGYGEGIYGKLYILSDPREYIKVVRHEGVYPSGLIESLWPMQKGLKAIEAVILPFFGRGVEWKRIRNFMQTDLLAPQSAAEYIPAVLCAAELASKGAPACADDFNDYLHRCAFDMFSSVMFGELMGVADPNTPTDDTNLEFVEAAVTFISNDANLLLSPKEAVLNHMLNIKTPMYSELEEAASVTLRIATEKVDLFKEKFEAGELDELQKKSYLANALKRLKEQPEGQDAISEEMLVGICWALLTASVDTTSGVLSWALVHIALNPDIQEKLFCELKSNLGKGGRLTPEVFQSRTKAPYLYSLLRESHRVTPALTQSISKQVSEEIEIHGHMIPPNQKFLFNNYVLQMDPAYVDEPGEFRPERWFPEQVEARKGTPQEMIDHPFFRDPFSQGARKCPGSRVATNEVLCFLSQLVLDYKMSIPGYKSYDEIPYSLKGTSTPIFPKLNLMPRGT